MKKGKIYLTEDPLFTPKLEKGKSVCIVAAGYSRPLIDNCVFLTLNDFAKNPYEYIKGISNLVFVGNSKIVNPANRIKPVFEVIHNNTPDLNKVIIDNNLFVSEPWRIIFAFITVNVNYLGFSYSFIAQTAYNKFVDCKTDFNPFSVENVIQQSKNVIDCNLNFCFPEIVFNKIEATDTQKQEYESLKNKLFEKNNTISPVLQGLNRFAKTSFKDRNVPTMNDLFKKKPGIINYTDLNIDKYYIQKIKDMIKYCNDIYSGLKEN